MDIIGLQMDPSPSHGQLNTKKSFVSASTEHISFYCVPKWLNQKKTLNLSPPLPLSVLAICCHKISFDFGS